MGLYLRKNSTVWWMRYGASGRKIDESTGTHDRRKAELVLKQRRTDVDQRRFAQKMGLDVPDDLADARLTLADFLERFEGHYVNAGGPDLRESRERSWRGDLAALRSVLDFFARKGAGRVSAVVGRHVEAFRDWRLTTGVSGATVNKSLRCGKAAWSWAVRAGLARTNPFKGVKPVKLARYDPRNLSDVEARKVLDAACGHALFPLVAIALYAGLREGELIALEWPEVNLGTEVRPGAIRVRCTETFRTKSRKPRFVPVAPELRAILKPIARAAGLCFSTATGNALDDADLRHAVARIAKKAGVAFTLHDLRRTFAGMLAARGVPTTRIRDYLGHASVATTEGYYVARDGFEADDVAKLHFGITPDGTAADRSAPAEPGRESA